MRKPKPGTGTSDMIPLANNWYNLFTRTTDLVHVHHFTLKLSLINTPRSSSKWMYEITACVCHTS